MVFGDGISPGTAKQSNGKKVAPHCPAAYKGCIL